MKTILRTILFLLCGVMLVSAVACNDGNAEESGEQSTTEPAEDATQGEQTETEPETTE